jgi:hypothetical protein
MAVIRGPLFSVSASGSIGKAITYQRDIKGFACRRMPIPPNRKTVAQLAQRERHVAGLRAWQSLIQTQRNIWNAYTDNDNNKGYHAFMSQYIRRTGLLLPQYQLPPSTGYCLTGEHLVGELTVGGGWIDPTGAE